MKLQVEPVKLEIENKEAAVNEAVELCKTSLAGNNAWILAESPRRVVFKVWDGSLEDQLAKEFTSLIVFCPVFEMRMEKPFGAQKGWIRSIKQTPQGDGYMGREMSALFRTSAGEPGGSLVYEEYFREDASGFLQPKGWRLCKVEDR